MITGLVDYWAKVALTTTANPTQTARDAVASLEAAIAEAETLMGHSLVEDCADPDPGQVFAVVVVCDNGVAYKSDRFARFIASHPWLAHVRTRYRSPQTNGVIERFYGSLKYEHLYRREVANGAELGDECQAYRRLYNEIRPHESLELYPPIDTYLAASREHGLSSLLWPRVRARVRVRPRPRRPTDFREICPRFLTRDILDLPRLAVFRPPIYATQPLTGPPDSERGRQKPAGTNASTAASLSPPRSARAALQFEVAVPREQQPCSPGNRGTPESAGQNGRVLPNVMKGFDQLKPPKFGQVKGLLLVLGVGLALAQALLAWERGAPPTEVLAPVLYIPVFAGAIFFGLAGGLIAAVVSSVLYLLVLVDQSAAIGTRLFVGLFINRATTFAFYGVLVALGTRYVESRLRKLDLYDQIDDETELYNSSFFLADADLELTRSRRYQSIFSVVEVRMDRELFTGTSRRSYRRTLKEFAQLLRGSVRSVDRPARVADEGSDRFLIILPETGAEGSAILTERLESAARQFLESRHLTPNGTISARAITLPDGQDSLAALRREVAETDTRRRALAHSEGAVA